MWHSQPNGRNPEWALIRDPWQCCLLMKVLGGFTGAIMHIYVTATSRRNLLDQPAHDETAMTFFRTLAGFALAAALPQIALAGDWQYCLAPSHSENKIYVSTPFPASDPLKSVEAAFDRMLSQARLRHDEVQCPRADDEPSINMMRQQAAGFNRGAGNIMINLRWHP
jgi:hypothetical protein